MRGWFGTYVAVILLLILVMKYIEGRTGVFLLCFFIAVPIISLLLTLFTRRYVDIKITSPPLLYKNSDFEITVDVASRKFSVVCILMKVFVTPPVTEKNKTLVKPVCFTYIDSQPQTFTLSGNFNMGGLKKIDIEYYILDLCQFGFLSKKKTMSIEIPVIFEIPENIDYSLVLQDVNSKVENDPEESDETTINTLNLMPGYDHRPYIIGDPLKKINWKLSARLGELMTRLDESINGITLNFFIFFNINDLENMKTTEQYNTALENELRDFETLVESCLGLVLYFVKLGFICRVICQSANDLEQYICKTIDDVTTLTISLAQIDIILHSHDKDDFGKTLSSSPYNFHAEDDVFFLFSNPVPKSFLTSVQDDISKGQLLQIFTRTNIKNDFVYNVNNDNTVK